MNRKSVLFAAQAGIAATTLLFIAILTVATGAAGQLKNIAVRSVTESMAETLIVGFYPQVTLPIRPHR